MHAPEQLDRRNAWRGFVDQQHVATEHLAVHVFQITAQVALALAEREAEQAHEDRQVIAAAWLHHKGLLDEDFEQLFKRRLVFRLGLTALQLFIEADAERPEEARENRLNQRFFRAEVIVHRCQVDAGLAGDQTQ
ncbi:hypothetical protein D3C81_1809600 [compost metagenome]